MAEMLEYSIRLGEKLIRHATPDVTEDKKDFVMDTYKRHDSFYYPRFRDIIVKNNPNLIKEEIDKIFMCMAESALSAENPFVVTVHTLFKYLVAEDEEDILDEIEVLTRSEYLVQEYRDNKRQ